MTTNALDHLSTFAEKHNLPFSIADHYGEPGYTDADAGIILSNWNDVPESLQEQLEEQGFGLEWDDEWISIGEGPLYVYRTQPDSYVWTPSFALTDGGAIGRHELFVVDSQDCSQDREVPDFNSTAMDEYLDYLKVDRDNIDHYLVAVAHADTFDLDLSLIGFELLDGEYETGLHAHQDDDPTKVLKELEGRVHDGLEVIFSVDSVGQFDCRWKVWVRKTED